MFSHLFFSQVITNEEAEKRGKTYDASGMTYLFDLDFHDSDGPFSVDAGTYGNASHFINHSVCGMKFSALFLEF